MKFTCPSTIEFSIKDIKYVTDTQSAKLEIRDMTRRCAQDKTMDNFSECRNEDAVESSRCRLRRPCRLRRQRSSFLWRKHFEYHRFYARKIILGTRAREKKREKKPENVSDSSNNLPRPIFREQSVIYIVAMLV